MKKLLFLIIATALFVSCQNETKPTINIIPQPKEIKLNQGKFKISGSTKISFDKEFNDIDKVINYLNNFFNKSCGFQLETSNEDVAKNFIHLKYDKTIPHKEGYNFISTKDGITISASNSQGIFYGVQTLLQLLPYKIYSQEQTNFTPAVAWVEIKDEPRFNYRGGHLDVGRYFVNVENIKKYIDYLAMHKMNKFHWHLTEDQGWRVEIKKYPKLTTISSQRKESMQDGKPHGGFYTQEEIKDIVKYAADRFITVIPEIEMPGHSLAVLAAYPELSCTGETFEVGTEWGVYDDVYCAGNEKTYKFLENVLDEVIELFPSEYIHIGGDECPKVRWEKCKKCQAKIKREKLKNEHELQSYFIQRMEKYLLSKGKKIIGWDEILEGGLAPQATVMSWRGEKGGIEAAKQKHDVIMTPTSYCYFDYYQGNPENEPLAIGGYLTLSKVYSYNPIPKELTEDEGKYILGTQANVWGEYLPTFKNVEYMLMPRLSALSEVCWTPLDKKDFNSFTDRLNTQLDRYDELNINYAKSAYNVNISSKFIEETKSLQITMETELPNLDIYYTLDGTEPSKESNKYTKPFALKESANIQAVSYQNNKRLSNITNRKVTINKAFGKNITIKNPFSEKYAGQGNYTLVDGQYGSKSYTDSYWQGFEEVDFEATVALEKLTKINNVKIGFMHKVNSWIFSPEYVEFSFSKDGKNFSTPIKVTNDLDMQTSGVIIKRFKTSNINEEYQYVKIFAKNIGQCPAWHYRAGGKAWIFTDEIEIN
ncbi:MAG: beta-N-acetylhexosaminidase [Ignavibacteriae bacterium]|nr:MAG: beta-N-acetylhexosaminidase [Ignavibacteriota bacterium]